MPCQHLPLLPSLEALEGLLASGADACPDVCCMDGSDPDRDGCMEDVDAWGRGEQVSSIAIQSNPTQPIYGKRHDHLMIFEPTCLLSSYSHIPPW